MDGRGAWAERRGPGAAARLGTPGRHTPTVRDDVGRPRGRRTVRPLRVRREQPLVPAGEGGGGGSHPGRGRGAGGHVRRDRCGRSPRHRRPLPWEVRAVRPRDRRNRRGTSRPRGDDQARAAFDELGMDAQRDEREQRVTPLELFFDLVVVFAFTQVTELMSDDLTWRGIGRGLLVLAAIWWAWTGYAWLTNALEPEEGQVRAGMFGAMAAMLVVALARPGAFGADAVLFGVAYLLVRLLNLVLYAIAGRRDPDLLRALIGFAPAATIGPACTLLARVRRRRRADGALGRRARRPVRGSHDRTRAGLAHLAVTLRGTVRAHRHHRARRVDHRARRRSRRLLALRGHHLRRRPGCRRRGLALVGVFCGLSGVFPQA